MFKFLRAGAILLFVIGMATSLFICWYKYPSFESFLLGILFLICIISLKIVILI